MLNLLVFKGENGEIESGDQHRQTVTTLHQVSENMDRQFGISTPCQGERKFEKIREETMAVFSLFFDPCGRFGQFMVSRTGPK